MRKKLTNWALVFCLFTFLLIVLGGGLRLNPGGALLAALTGTPLVVYAFNCLVARRSEFAYQPEPYRGVYETEAPLPNSGR
jgi:hypothetical protein